MLLNKHVEHHKAHFCCIIFVAKRNASVSNKSEVFSRTLNQFLRTLNDVYISARNLNQYFREGKVTNAFKRQNSAPEIGYSIVSVFSLQNECKIGYKKKCFGRRRKDKVTIILISFNNCVANFDFETKILM